MSDERRVCWCCVDERCARVVLVLYRFVMSEGCARARVEAVPAVCGMDNSGESDDDGRRLQPLDGDVCGC
eukprot:2200880-Rhodomonas_salina.1